MSLADLQQYESSDEELEDMKIVNVDTSVNTVGETIQTTVSIIKDKVITEAVHTAASIVISPTSSAPTISPPPTLAHLTAFRLKCGVPTKELSSNTAFKIKDYLDAKKYDGFDLPSSIRAKKDFSNPYLLTKIVNHFKIDEIGSNYPRLIFDPHGYAENDFEEAIRRNSSQSAMPIQETVKTTTTKLHLKSQDDNMEPIIRNKRKSKWDSQALPS